MQKIKLSNPVKIDGVEVHEISLRTPKVRDLIAAGKKNVDEAEKEVNLIANLGEISPETVQELDLRDYIKIQEWLRDFLSASTQKN
ncbi:MAG: phage tail assembly protein [Alphaproteobacteria bacterium]|nr:phage tail assembly protein [Alphaproteobacteria bacterium]